MGAARRTSKLLQSFDRYDRPIAAVQLLGHVRVLLSDSGLSCSNLDSPCELIGTLTTHIAAIGLCNRFPPG